jgi:PLP dependent protein
MTVSTAIATNLAALHRRIAAACREAGRDPATVTLVAAAKTQDAAALEAALQAGQRIFGENRVQEAQAKYPALKAKYLDLRLHLIGPLQTNKARDAVRLFDAVETLDRPKLAQALAAAMAGEGRRPAVFVQVNTGEEPQKAGVLPRAADAFIAECRARWNLAPVGLMCIPPVQQDPGPHFALLAEIARRNGLKELSMGMSADFETAIKRGATLIRLGTAIFGPRGTP